MKRTIWDRLRLLRRIQRRAAAHATVFSRADLDAARRDFGAVTFFALALAALVASAPNTLMKLVGLHPATDLGLAQSWAGFLVLEVAALLVKVATLYVPEWRGRLNTTQAALLVFVTIANYQQARADLPTGNGYEQAIFIASMPFLQWLFSTLAVSRAWHLHMERMRRVTPPTAEERAQARFQSLRDDVWARFLERAVSQMADQADALEVRTPPQLPEQVVYPRPGLVRAQPVLVPQIECPQCQRSATRMQLQTAPQHQGWRCECGYKVPLVAIPHSDGLDSAL
jgi:hypothetical protein